MSMHELKDGSVVIASGGLWLPGCYESKRAARFAFRLPNATLSQLRDASIARGDGVITFSDVQTAAKRLRDAKKQKEKNGGR